MTYANPMAEDKTGREISKEFLSALKKYFTVFVIFIYIVGMFGGFVVLYS